MPLYPWRRIWPAVVCVLAAALLSLYTIDRWRPADFALPVKANQDWVEVAARVQIAAEQGWRWGNTYGRIDRLGAPAVADWTLNPTPDRLVFWLTGRLANLIGVYGAINLVAGLGFAIGALSFYYAARLLRWSPVWAVAGGLLFAFSTYNLGWSLMLSLGLTFPWPIALVALHWIGANRPDPAQTARWSWLALGSGLCLGAGNPYYSFLAAQLGVFALLRQWQTPHSRRRRAGWWFLLGVVGAFGLTHASYFLARFNTGETIAIERNLQGTEVYALRPIEWFMPPDGHWWGALARMGMRYRNESMFHGKEFSAYLGIITLVGLLLLAYAALRRCSAGSPRAHGLPIGVWAIAWVLLFSVVGGLNTMLGFLGIDVFRATLRYSIVPGTIGLFWALDALRRRTAWHPRLGGALAVAVVTFGLWDQTPRPPRTAATAEARNSEAHRQAIADSIVEAIGPQGAVFQLPATPFPEAGWRRGFPDYDHLHLFLHAPQLRLSYGGPIGSYSDQLGNWFENLPADLLAPALEAAGFDAVVIDRRAYRDRGEHWIGPLKGTQSPIDLPADAPQVAFKLQSGAETPAIPGPGAVVLDESWEPSPSRWSVAQPAKIGLFVDADWHKLEHDREHHWRWTRTKNATIRVDDAYPPQRPFELTFFFSATGPTRAECRWNGETIWQGQLGLTPIRITLPDLRCEAGAANALTLHIDDSPRLKSRDTRDLGMRVLDLRVNFTD